MRITVTRKMILKLEHDDVIKWKHFPRNWPFVREIHRSPVNFPHKGQWRGALMFSLIYAWINDWVNNREAGDLRRQHGHYDVIVMNMSLPSLYYWLMHVCLVSGISFHCLGGCDFKMTSFVVGGSPLARQWVFWFLTIIDPGSDDILLKENNQILVQISIICIAQDPVCNESRLVEEKAWHQQGYFSSEPMMAELFETCFSQYIRL